MSRGPCLFQDVGREGIRTLGMLSHAPIFEIGTLNHSVTPPLVPFCHVNFITHTYGVRETF